MNTSLANSRFWRMRGGAGWDGHREWEAFKSEFLTEIANREHRKQISKAGAERVRREIELHHVAQAVHYLESAAAVATGSAEQRYEVGSEVLAEHIFAPAALAQVRADLRRWPGRELLWVFGLNDTATQITWVECRSRGDATSVLMPEEYSDCHGTMHNHPTGPLEPSEQDQRVTRDLDPVRFADVICNTDSTVVRKVSWPRRPRHLLHAAQERAARYGDYSQLPPCYSGNPYDFAPL